MQQIAVQRHGFSEPQLHDVRDASIAMLRASGTSKTSLQKWGLNPEYRECVRTAVLAFYESKVPGPFRSRFGVEPGLLLDMCTLRHHAVEDRTTRVEWHMDVNLVRTNAPFMTNWVALDDTGTTAPALAFARFNGRHTDETLEAWWIERLKAGTSDIRLSDEELEQEFGPHEVIDVPVAAGGSLSFEQFTLHRTQRIETQTTARTSLEFRAFHPGTPPGIVMQFSTCIVPQSEHGPYSVVSIRDGKQNEIDVFHRSDS